MNKVKVILGLFFSFCIFIFIGYISLNEGWAFAPIYMVVYTAVPFLILNFVVFFIFKFLNFPEIKKGIKWGNLFAILYLVLGLFVYISNYPAYREAQKENELLTEGLNSSSISDCDKISLPDGKWVCIMRIARMEQKPEYCESVTKSLSAKELCYVEALTDSKDKILIAKYCSIIQNEAHKKSCNSLLEKLK